MSFLGTIFNFLSFATYNTSPPTATNAQPIQLQADVNGNLKVAIASNPSTGGKSWDMTTTSQYRKLAIKSGPGTFYEVFGVNEGGTPQWLMFFDATTQPANGAAPLFAAIYVPANTAYSLSDADGIPFTTGLSWCVSSTKDTLTLNTGAFFSAAVKKI